MTEGPKIVSLAHLGLGRLPQLPIPCRLSFRYLLEELGKAAPTGSVAVDRLNSEALKRFKSRKELQGTIDTDEALEAVLPDILELMSLIFPINFGHTVRFAATVPFLPFGFFASQAFAEVLLDKNQQFRGKTIEDEPDLGNMVLTNLLKFVLIEIYKAKISLNSIDNLIEVEAMDTGLKRFERISMDLSFCRVVCDEAVSPLPDERLTEALSHVNQPEKLLALIPYHQFRVEGFSIVRSFDVTREEALSRIKQAVLSDELSDDIQQIKGIEMNLKILAQDPSLKLTLYTMLEEKVYALSSDLTVPVDIPGMGRLIMPEALAKMPHVTSMAEQDSVSYCLLARINPTEYEQELKASGFKTMVAGGLSIDKKLMGVAEITSKQSFDKFSLKENDIKAILSLLGIATLRRLERINRKIEQAIKFNCTSLHPSIEWRFRLAAQNLIKARLSNIQQRMEPIIFENVFPLYGLTDIKSSSALRTKAIQSDLISQLERIDGIIQKAMSRHAMPIFKFSLEKLHQVKAELNQSITTGLELKVTEFIQGTLEPILKLIPEHVPELAHEVRNYNSMLDKKYGTFYFARNEFDRSVEALNAQLSRYLDQAQQKAQLSYPHYFEKHVTDGVDHNIYIGSQLSPHLAFDKTYVKDLRLWQLITTCHLARITEELKSELPVALDTTHLIVVQDMPLSVEFRYEEKRFDVRGGYSIRYELIKKRIDKATIKNTSERIVKPGSLVIVFSQPHERDEYLGYIDHLKGQGILSGLAPDIFDLSELSDVSGLQAIRAGISPEFLGAESVSENSADQINKRIVAA